MAREGEVRPLGVLLADDEAAIRAVLSIALRREGLRVWPAACGLEAVEVFRAHRPVIDVALLDVAMPRLTGPEALARMRQWRPGLPCVFITGHAAPCGAAELHALGARVLYKPFALNEVVEAVRPSGEKRGPRRARKRGQALTRGGRRAMMP
jgi:two-component system cell cycle sensor histidine kinase/response regulator CckA